MKKIIMILCALFTFVITTSFLSFLFGDSDIERKMLGKILPEVSKTMKKKYGLYFGGISEEAPDGKYKRIGFELTCKRILTKDEARALLLNCAQEIIEIFNSHPKFLPHMINGSFTRDNIIVNIYIQPPNVSRVYYPDYIVFTLYEDTLEFKTKAPQQTGFYYTEEIETYDEAMKIAGMK